MSDPSHEDKTPASVWLRPERTSRTDRPALSQERIVQGAIELLDEQGLDGLSLRRLAEHLGSGVTSLYWYIKTKEELLELAVDAIFVDVPGLAEPDGDWKAELRVLAGWLRGVILRHPWSAPLFGSFLGIGPNALLYAEAVLNVLGRTGLSQAYLNGGLSAIFHYVIGSAITDAAWITTLRHVSKQKAEWAAVLEANARKAVEKHTPEVAAYLKQFGVDDIEKRFAMGLEVILDGLTQWSAKE